MDRPYLLLSCHCIAKLHPICSKPNMSPPFRQSSFLLTFNYVCSARGNYYLYTAGSSPYALDGYTMASSEHTDKFLLRNKQLIKNCLIFLFLTKLFANI